MYDLHPDVTYTTTVLRPSNRNRNKRGLSLSRPDKIRTRRPKRQNSHVLGSTPYMRSSL